MINSKNTSPKADIENDNYLKKEIIENNEENNKENKEKNTLDNVKDIKEENNENKIKTNILDNMNGQKKKKKSSSEKKIKKTVSSKKIDKKTKTTKKKVKSEVKKTVETNYPPIPSSIEERWKDYEKTKEMVEKSQVYLGAHISASGGVQNAPINSFNISAASFALFLKNQRQWDSPALSSENIKNFEENCKKYNYDKNMILPHGSYLINLANPDVNKREKSYKAFLDDIKRCEQLKIKMYNFHPGSTVGQCSVEEGIKNIADCINRVHKETSDVIIVLENSAGQKNSVGSKFEHLRDIINIVDDKTRIGVCLDTCHTLAAGYDIKTYEKFDNVMNKFNEIINIKYLKAVHLNDSKSDLGSGLDRHENIGKGTLTTETFKYVMNSKYFKNIPIILETPVIGNDDAVYKYEIAYLYTLVDN